MELYNYILIIVVGLLLIIFLYDIFQRKHTILRIFPVVGHLRYLLENIGPELRKYWVANDKEEMPFTRSEWSWVYATSKKQNNNFGLGSSGVATHNVWLIRDVDVKTKSKRAAQYLQGLRKEILQLTYACGYQHPCQFTGKDIEISTGVNMFDPLEKILGYEKVTIPLEELNDILTY